MELLPDTLQYKVIPNDVGGTCTHVFEQKAINAINGALAINRPLLIWGEPGIGKSQLAKAAAMQLKRVFIPFVADAHTESHDLLWKFDAVARLAEAQIQDSSNPDREKLEMERFISPGPLWWAFDWGEAQRVINKANKEKWFNHQEPKPMGGCLAENGAVVLIDEIDKTSSDVPNGLLEALGNNRFQPQGLPQAIECKGEKPLIMITTNEERSLPDAFVRRCLSLHLAFPKQEKQLAFLLERAKVNFPALHTEKYPELNNQTIIESAAEMLLEDRAHAKANSWFPLPGLAEYFDLLRGTETLAKQTTNSPVSLIQQLQPFTYQKHPGFHSKPE